MLAQSKNSSASTTLGKFYWEISRTQSHNEWAELTLHKKRNEGNPEHDKNGDDTPFDPLEHGYKVVTTTLTRKDVSTRRVSADGKLLVKSTEEDESEHEDLDRHHNQLQDGQFAIRKTTTVQLTMLLMWKPGCP